MVLAEKKNRGITDNTSLARRTKTGLVALISFLEKETVYMNGRLETLIGFLQCLESYAYGQTAFLQNR